VIEEFNVSLLISMFLYHLKRKDIIDFIIFKTKTSFKMNMQTFNVNHVIADGRDIYNFSAGPCVLPKAVLEKSAEEMLNYRGSGQSVMELSHR
jgi:hypothetical protein